MVTKRKMLEGMYSIVPQRRHPTANRDLKAPLPAHRPTVAACWQAYETFVLCATIAQGLLPLIARRFGPQVWQHHTRYRRTPSRAALGAHRQAGTRLVAR